MINGGVKGEQGVGKNHDDLRVIEDLKSEKMNA